MSRAVEKRDFSTRKVVSDPKFRRLAVAVEPQVTCSGLLYCGSPADGDGRCRSHY